MKILFCSSTHLSRELGAAKVLLELAEEMRGLGWTCELLSPEDVVPKGDGHKPYHAYLREHLRRVAGEFDVVEYDHNHLPYPRGEFPAETLFVARSVLLAHHFKHIPIPRDKRLKSRIHYWLKKRSEARACHQAIARAHCTVQESDLVNVLNFDDEAELIRCGIPKEKIAVIPDGLSQSIRKLFDGVPSELPPEPKVAFIGTFDGRKGAPDFPAIIEAISAATPGIGFRLMGTFRSEADVLSAFPGRLQGRIEVVPRYDPVDLPKLLAPCSVGFFPSYIEGFGLGVLEMLAASIPVVAYNSPGPPMMLPPEYLVPRGAVEKLADKVNELLRDRERLASARRWAKRRSQEFCWASIAQRTSQLYTEHRSRRQVTGQGA